MAKHNDGMKVSNLYIAQIKQKHGIIERENYNKPKSEKGGQPECPKEKETVDEIPIKARTNSPEFYIPREAGYIGIYNENRTNQADQRQFTAYVGIE